MDMCAKNTREVPTLDSRVNELECNDRETRDRLNQLEMCCQRLGGRIDRLERHTNIEGNNPVSDRPCNPQVALP